MNPELRVLLAYLAKLGLTGFGGPVALVGHMERDLVETQKTISLDNFRIGLALANVAPGPLAAQMAMWLGYLKGGAWGAFLAGLTFAGPPILLVIGLSVLYVRFHGLWWLDSFLKGMGPAVLVIMLEASIRLAAKTLLRKKLLWLVFLILLAATALFRAEISLAFMAAGFLSMKIYTPRQGINSEKIKVAVAAGEKKGNFFNENTVPLAVFSVFTVFIALSSLGPLFLLFIKAGALTFGTGMAILPLLYKDIVEVHAWIGPQEFVDAIAIGMMTPGPVLVATAFMGYLASALPGAMLAPIGVFAPVYFFTVLSAPYFKRYSDNPRLKAFVEGVTAAAIGALAGATILLIAQTLPNAKSLCLFLVALAFLLKFKVPDPIVVLASGLVGLIIF